MRNPDIRPTHPGELLREDTLPAVDKFKAKVVLLLGISRMRLGEILAERKPVTLKLAAQFSELFGSAPRLWIGLPGNHGVWCACREISVSGIPSLIAAEQIQAWVEVHGLHPPVECRVCERQRTLGRPARPAYVPLTRKGAAVVAGNATTAYARHAILSG